MRAVAFSRATLGAIERTENAERSGTGACLPFRYTSRLMGTTRHLRDGKTREIKCIMNDDKTSRNKQIVSWLTKIVILGAFVVGVVVCLVMVVTSNLTQRETALLTVVLTVFSVLATWLVSHIYSQSQLAEAISQAQKVHRDNLRMYALKAAEKVYNLSNELVRLAAYLESELEPEDYEAVPAAFRGKIERMESVVHMLHTLKSVNDRSLSDWEGVIGDELDEQREEQREREEELQDTVLRLEELVEGYRREVRGSQADADDFRSQILDLNRQLQSGLWVTRLGGTARKRSPKATRDVHSACPKCGGELAFRQREKRNGIKALRCKQCGSRLISRSMADGAFQVELRQTKEEHFDCPDCGTDCLVLLDTFPGGGVAHASCDDCGTQLRVTRGMDGIRIHHVPPREPDTGRASLTDDLLEQVVSLLPEQPWPKAVHQEIAGSLGVKPGLVARAIQELIVRRRVMPQFDGVVYIPRDQDLEGKPAETTGGPQAADPGKGIAGSAPENVSEADETGPGGVSTQTTE